MSFRDRYYSDPVGFSRDCIVWPAGHSLTLYQNEMLDAIPVYHRVAQRGPRGLGKTAEVAIIVIWFSLTRDGIPNEDWKAITSAAVHHQLAKYIWPEVHKWSRRLRWDVIGRRPFDERHELLDMSLKLSTGEAFASSSDKPWNIEGGHAAHVLWVVDEAKAVPDSFFDSIEGSLMAGLDTFHIAISTPGPPVGRFFDICSRRPGYEDWHVLKVTRPQAEEAFAKSGGLFGVDPEKAARRAKQWGASAAVYVSDVEGEFSAVDSDGVIPYSWIAAAQQRWLDWRQRKAKDDYSRTHHLVFRAVGADVADSGGDDTVMALLFEETQGSVGAADGELTPPLFVIDELRYTHGEDLMQTTGRIAGVLRAHVNGEQGRAIVDGIGIGAGVAPRLRELGFEAAAFIASAASEFRDASNELGFVNARAAGWWNLREMLQPDNEAGVLIALPSDDRLVGELCAPRYKLMSGGRIQVESKDDLRKPTRLGRSTDAADAVIHACWFDRAGDVGAKWGRIAARSQARAS